jgi:gamma-glutamylcyclotransferase (GGCT)/AIG2-like uncharacterized protein YtfP
MRDFFKGLFGKVDPNFKYFLEEAKKASKFTPDIGELQCSAYQPLFVYNEWQGNSPKFDKLKDPRYGGQCRTEDHNFVLFKKDLGIETRAFAIEIPASDYISKPLDIYGYTSHMGDLGQIEGELYTIPTAAMIALDSANLNTIQFERVRKNVLIPYRETTTSVWQTHNIEAWMYVARRDFWDDQITGPSSRDSITSLPRLIVEGSEENNDARAYYLFDYTIETHRE